MDRCKTHTLQLVSVFLEIRRRSGAWVQSVTGCLVQAHYNKDFVVTKTDIDAALIPRLELMRDITEKVCCDRIAYYERQS